MKKLALVVSFIFSLNSVALSIGQQIDSFKLTGYPKTVDLNSLRGKYVVLEWYNDGCPFVRKHYDSNNMQNLQRRYKDKVSWLTINSSAPGKQGHLPNLDEAKKKYQQEAMLSHSLLLDTGGKIGKYFSAKTTPHMYIIDPKGILIYQGAIDSIPSADKSDIGKSINYVDRALESALKGEKVKFAKTRAYGCSVKY